MPFPGLGREYSEFLFDLNRVRFLHPPAGVTESEMQARAGNGRTKPDEHSSAIPRQILQAWLCTDRNQRPEGSDFVVAYQKLSS
jgi:hypothetical protein